MIAFSIKWIKSSAHLHKCCSITDDLVIYSYSEEDHDQVLFQVLATTKCVGLRFSRQMYFKCIQIPFFGMLIGAYGIMPYPKKIEALNHLPLPGNVREMQLFLGIVNNLSRFSPKIANLTRSLRPLVKKENVYKTEKHHKLTFKAIIKELSNDRVLKYYDPARKLFLECDASGVGAGFTVLQNFTVDLEQDTDESFLTAEYLANLLPIANGSQTFTRCKRRYANIERELFWQLYVAQKKSILYIRKEHNHSF